MRRRTFLQNSSLLAAGSLLPGLAFSAQPPQAPNSLPQWRGFNLLDFFNPMPRPDRPVTTRQHLQWISDWGFNFVRIPIAYPYYLKFDRSRPVKPEEVYQFDPQRIAEIVTLVDQANEFNLHVSVNLHRAPGYCINAGFIEPYNLWTDTAAREAFYFHWNMWAKTFRGKSSKQVSFDLVNEPSMRVDMNDQHSPSGPVPGAAYRQVAMGALEAIRKENPNHLVVADGNSGGNTPIPEIADLPIAQSCRGYYPHEISHYQAPWANKEPEKCPLPVYPGKIGEKEYNRAAIETYYQPWIDLKNKGVGVHCGECGCWKKTPHQVFLSWFEDVVDVLHQHQIGYGLWNFIGDFGLLNSGRADVAYTDFHGYQLDQQLLNLLKRYN